jgi:hypothetical protein
MRIVGTTSAAMQRNPNRGKRHLGPRHRQVSGRFGRQPVQVLALATAEPLQVRRAR